MNKKFLIIVFGVLIFFGLLSLLWRFIFTSRETADVLSQSFFRQMINPEGKIIGEISGNIQDGIVVKNLQLTEIKGMPPGATLHCAWLSLKWNGFSRENVTLLFENIRLKLADSDPIIFSGKYENGEFFVNVFSTSIDIHEILVLLGREEARYVEGRLSDIDVDINGVPEQFSILGKVTVEKIVYGGFQLSDAVGRVALKLHKPNKEDFIPHGEITVTEGMLQMPKSQVKLNDSRLILGNDWKNPGLDLHGTSTVDGTDIEITLKGTKNNPDFQVSSIPNLPKEKVLLMLLTGKGWKGLDKTFQTQKFSPDLITDVIDYLWFGGRQNELAQKLGIKDISVLYDEKEKGIGLKKIITSNFDLGYSIKQDTTQPTNNIDQKFEAELKLNPHLSLTVDKELKAARDLTQTGATESLSEDKFWLKFKSEF